MNTPNESPAAAQGSAAATSPVNDLPDLVTEDFMIPGGNAGIELFVRNKRLKDLDGFAPGNTLLFVHGATYPAELCFDLRVEEFSWMEYIASFGCDVYCVNVRGYGKSTKPPEMSVEAAKNKPIVDTEVAVRDFEAAAKWIMKRRGIRSLNVMGWSWGTVIAGTYTARHPRSVNSLVLHAPVWIRKTASLVNNGNKLGAWRAVTAKDAIKRWNTGLPRGVRTAPKAWQDLWAQAIFASDPVGAAAKPPFLRAPNGVVQDIRKYWLRGRAKYKAADIRVPTLIVMGAWDADTPTYMAQALYPELVNASPKRMVIIGECTHMAMLEKPRMTLFREVQLFLAENESRKAKASPKS